MISSSSLLINMWISRIQLSYSSRIIKINNFHFNWLVLWVLFIKIKCSRLINMNNVDRLTKAISWHFSSSMTRVIFSLTDKTFSLMLCRASKQSFNWWTHASLTPWRRMSGFNFLKLRPALYTILIFVKLIESLRIDCSLIYLDELSMTLMYSYLLISRTVAKCSSKLRYDLFKLRS